MNKYINFILLTTILITTSCHPETEPPVEPPVDLPVIELGKIGMVENGNDWISEAEGATDSYDQISILSKKLVNSNGTFQHFHIYGIPAKIGVYKLEKADIDSISNGVPIARVFWILDGDQYLWEIGSTSDQPDDFVEIVKFDSINRIVEGRFSITVSNYRNLNVQWGLPELLELREGVFHVKLDN